jgi:mycothiol synthase
MDLTIRPYADDDAVAVADLLNAAEVHVGATAGFSATEVREWSAQWRDISRDSRVLAAPDGSVIAFGAAEPPPDGGFIAASFGTVAPRWRGRGLGRHLLRWQFDRIEEMRREAGADVAWTIDVYANVLETDALRLYDRFGMSVRRYWFDMEARTSAAAEASDGFAGFQVSGFRVETAESVDAKALYAAHIETFADHFEYQARSFENWNATAIGSALFRPELSRVVYAGDEIASYVLGYDEADPRRLNIAQVGTRRPWRGHGLASALLRDVLAASAIAGKEVARLSVDAASLTGAVGVYERAGFAVTARAVLYAKTLGQPGNEPERAEPIAGTSGSAYTLPI